MFNNRSILKQTVGKYIQNYHILEHVQWQLWKLGAELFVLEQYFNRIFDAAKKLYELYEGIFLNKRNISTYHETYPFSFSPSFLIFTFIPLQVPLIWPYLTL